MKIIAYIHNVFAKAYIVLLDIMVISFAPILALIVRLEGDFTAYDYYLSNIMTLLPLSIAMTLIVFHFFGLYKILWSYATVQDMLTVVIAGAFSTLIIAAIGMYVNIDVPISVYLISCIFKISLLIAIRLAIKINHIIRHKTASTNEIRFLIVGAGDAGAMIAHEIKRRNAGNKLVGFIDDDEDKIGSHIIGVPILGKSDNIEALAKRHMVTEIIIAIPSGDGDTIRRISGLCRHCGCRVRTLPGLYELIENKNIVPQLRDIDISDLLRREPITFDTENISAYIRGKDVLITGAGGSIGSELARQISRLQPKTIYLLGRGENSIHEIYSELTNSNVDIQYIPVIADVSDSDRIFDIFRDYKPQIVFHAAAHKHVPLMERQPSEAIKVNVFGTKNLVEASKQNSVEIFVMISTDKAVNPTNVMGASKRIAELIVQGANRQSGTKFLAVRFGNVLGSRGSVIPLFRKQIAMGGPITITHPDIIRYFMTIPEAAQLVLQAGAMAEGGEVFLLDMGKPVRILDMARDLVELHGLVPDKDIKFVFTGLRPGEKLYEELLTAEEGAEQTSNKKIYKAKLKIVNNDRLDIYLLELKQAKTATEIITTMDKWMPNYKSTSLKDN